MSLIPIEKHQLEIDKPLPWAVFDPAADNGAPFIHHGLEFFNLQPNDSVILQSLIYQQMIEQPHTLA